MAVSANFYRQADAKAWNKEIDWNSDTIKCALATSAYTPNLDTHAYFSDITNEITGTGYTAGGATLTSPTIVYTAANSWGTAAATSTAYAVGDVVRPAAGNGFLYRASVAGTSGGAAPTWPTTIGATVTDGGVTWTNVGKGALVLDAADTSWSTATLTARYAIIYDSTGTAATSALIALIDFGADVSSTASTFLIVWPTQGIAIKTVY
jgi:hypothetical protein